RQYQYDARRQQGDGGGVFGDSQFTSTLSVNFHFPKIPRRTFFYPSFFYCAASSAPFSAHAMKTNPAQPLKM
ncbi:hypothetical protein ACB295_00005, partial [Aeromonas caviae]